MLLTSIITNTNHIHFVLLEMLLILLLTIIIVGYLTYLSIKPLIQNLLYSVPNEPKYIHSYIPILGFGLEMFKDPIGFIRSLYDQHGKTFIVYLQSKTMGISL